MRTQFSNTMSGHVSKLEPHIFTADNLIENQNIQNHQTLSEKKLEILEDTNLTFPVSLYRILYYKIKIHTIESPLILITSFVNR